MTNSSVKVTCIEAIRARLATESDPKWRIDLLAELAWLLVERHKAEAKELALRAADRAVQSPFNQQSPYKKGLGRAKLVLAQLAFRCADYQRSMQLSFDALALQDAVDDRLGMARAHGIIGVCYGEIGNKVELLDNLYKGLELAREIGCLQQQACILHDLADANDQSALLFEEALTLATEAGDEQMTALISANFGALLAEEGQLAEGTTLLENAERIAQQLGWRELLSYTLCCKGLLQEKLGQIDSATFHFEQGLEIAREHEDVMLTSLNLLMYATFEMGRSNFDLAVSVLLEGLEISLDANQIPNAAQFYTKLSDCFEKQHNYEMALYYFKQASELGEQLLAQQQEQQQQILAAAHEAETLRRAARFEIEKNAELEVHVAERTRALEASLLRESELSAELEAALLKEAEASELKTQIITNVSHEFRTPLTVISNSAELLNKYGARLTDQQQSMHHARIREAIFYLSDMLSDVMFVNAEGQTAIRPNPIIMSFASLVARIVGHPSCSLLGGTAVTVSADDNDQTLVCADIELLARIVSNLVANSVKYSPQEAPIDVQLKTDGVHIVIKVTDHGVGIPLTEQGKVYDLFYRAKNVETQRGTGLGLNIVRKIVASMQGKIELFSAGENKGTTFTVQVPIDLDISDSIADVGLVSAESKQDVQSQAQSTD